MSLLRKLARMRSPERWLMCACAAAIGFGTARLIGSLVVSEWPEMLLLWGLVLFPLTTLILGALVVAIWLAMRPIE